MNTLSRYKALIIGLGAVAIVFGFMVPKTAKNLGGVDFTQVQTVLGGVSATTTSSAIDIEGAERVSLSLNVSGLGASGLATSTFAVSVSVDGTNYVTYNKLIDNVTNTNAQGLTRVASKAIDSNTTAVLSMDLTNDMFKYFKVTDTITGTTTSIVTVKAMIQ